MAWETRSGNARRYYTRSRRVNGRVVREYVGSGRRGATAARHDAERRARKDEERLDRQAERAQIQALDDRVAEWDELAKFVIRAMLLAAGCHQHDRGRWRKRRLPRPPAQGAEPSCVSK